MNLMHNPEFRSISPNEHIPKDTLVWIEDTGLQNETRIFGPFIVLDGWGPQWFNKVQAPGPVGEVQLLDSETGTINAVSYGSFLFETYYVINEETQCIDAKISQQ